MVNTGELVITFLAGEKDRRGQMPSVSSMGDNERWRGVVEQDKQDPREVRAGMMLQMIMSKDQKGGLAQMSTFFPLPGELGKDAIKVSGWSVWSLSSTLTNSSLACSPHTTLIIFTVPVKMFVWRCGMMFGTAPESRVRVLPCCAARCGVRARKIHLVEFLPSVAAPPARRAQQRHGVTHGDILSCDTGQHLAL